MKTIDTIRDEIAGMLHWELVTADAVNGDDRGGWGGNWSASCIGKWKNTKEPRWPAVEHPIPTTLDGIAAMMPEDYRVNILQYSDGWYAHARHRQVSPGKIAHKAEQYATEYEARLRLTHAVLTATKGATHEK